MAFQQNPRRYDAEGRWLLPSWMPYPTDGSDREETRFAYLILDVHDWIKDLHDFVNLWSDVKIPYVVELVDFTPTDAEREAHCVWDEPHVTRVICHAKLAAADTDETIEKALRELDYRKTVHPKIGQAVRVRAGSVFEFRALTEDTFVNRALMQSFEDNFGHGWVQFLGRFVTGSSRFSKFFYANGTTNRHFLAGTRILLDGELVMEVRAVPDRRVVINGLLPTGEAVYWMGADAKRPTGHGIKRNILTESKEFCWWKFEEYLSCIFRRIAILGPDGRPLAYPAKPGDPDDNTYREIPAYRSSAEALERGETFQKLETFGHVEKFFLPSLRDPALWDHADVSKSDVDRIKDDQKSYWGRQLRERMDWTKRQTFE